MRKILITGASGFLGPYVVEALDRANWQLKLAVRRPVSVGSKFASTIVGEIGGETDWSEAVTGVDAVVHLAGIADRKQSTSETEGRYFFEVNTRGTLSLARAAAEHGVRDFVFLSTI